MLPTDLCGEFALHAGHRTEDLWLAPAHGRRDICPTSVATPLGLCLLLLLLESYSEAPREGDDHLGLYLHTLPLPHGLILASLCYTCTAKGIGLTRPLYSWGTSLRLHKQYGGEPQRCPPSIPHAVGTGSGVLPYYFFHLCPSRKAQHEGRLNIDYARNHIASDITARLP